MGMPEKVRWISPLSFFSTPFQRWRTSGARLDFFVVYLSDVLLFLRQLHHTGTRNGGLGGMPEVVEDGYVLCL